MSVSTTKILTWLFRYFNNYQLELIGYSSSAQGQVVVGALKDYGIELEATYHTERTRLIISHSYTQLIDFN